MPVDYGIDFAERIVYTRARGTLTLEDMRRLRDQLVADCSFDPEYRQVFDLTPADEITFTGDQIRAMAASTIFRTGVRRAFIAKTPTQIGVARMLEAYCEMHNQVIGVFREHATALQWIAAP